MNLAHEARCLGRGTQISDTDVLRTSVQEFLSSSIDPHISSSSPSSVAAASLAADMDTSFGGFGSRTTTSAMAEHAYEYQTSAILTYITSQASIGENETLEGIVNIVRRDEPYAPWTRSSSSPLISAGLPSFPNIAFEGDVESYTSLQDLSFNYDSFEDLSTIPQQTRTTTAAATATATDWASSRKGKEILVDQADLVQSKGPSSSPSLQFQQQELLLDEFRSPVPPSSADAAAAGAGVLLLPGSSPNPNTVASPRYRSLVRSFVGEMPPGHSVNSPFRPHRVDREFTHYPGRVSMKKKREPLIFKWATRLAPSMKQITEEMYGAGGSSANVSSPGREGLDPRSPRSVAHDLQLAVAHKIAERNRRMKFSHKLQTLISIVPLVNKKKDKVSVLSSTIDYIRQLNQRISALKKVEEEAPTASAPSTSRRANMEGEGVSPSVTREEELSLCNEAADLPSSSSPVGGGGGGPPVVVVEEGPAGDDTWVIKVEAQSRSRSLVQLLNVLVELELGVVSVDYGSTNGRFLANICVKNSKSSSTSGGELQATLCRVLEAPESSSTGSD